MPDIHIRRDHALGLSKARELAWQWAEEVEQQFGMSCTVIEGETSDTVEFTRSGVDGRLTVAPDHFELDAKLGFLLGAFSRKIETEIERNLDALLGQAAQKSSRAAAGKVSRAESRGEVRCGEVGRHEVRRRQAGGGPQAGPLSDGIRRGPAQSGRAQAGAQRMKRSTACGPSRAPRVTRPPGPSCHSSATA